MTLTLTEPAPGIGTPPEPGTTDLSGYVDTARDVAAWWWRLGFDVREQALLRWVSILGRRGPEITRAMRAEGGKTHEDATIELVIAIEHVRWAARNARRVLRPRRVPGAWLMPEQRAELAWKPVGVDKIAFTGSTRTATRILAAGAPTLTPVLTEYGGKDPAIVAADADVDHAAAQTLWGAMFNAGQTCVGIERAYAVDDVYDEFVRAIVVKASRLSAGPDGDIGAIAVPAQLDVIRTHIADAVDRGARVVLGGVEAITPPYVQPTILIGWRSFELFSGDLSIWGSAVRVGGEATPGFPLHEENRIMKHYMIGMYQPDGVVPAPEFLEPVMRELYVINDEMRAAGAWVFGGGLHQPDTATVLTTKGDDVVITDGPYTEGKEHLGGFTIVKAADLDEALGWARKIAGGTGLPIEVRPFHGEVDE